MDAIATITIVTFCILINFLAMLRYNRAIKKINNKKGSKPNCCINEDGTRVYFLDKDCFHVWSLSTSGDVRTSSHTGKIIKLKEVNLNERVE